MQQAEIWRPSKFELADGRLRGSRNPLQVNVGSRLVTDLIAALYAKLLPQHARGRLLDLGCGHVPLYATYRDHVTENVCVDWANSVHRNQHLDHECDLSEALPFPDQSFDTIVMSDVLEHLPEPALIWAEIARLLRPGGKILLNVPFYYWLHETPHDYYRYTEYALRRFAERAGLAVVLLVPIGGAPEVLTDIGAKTLLRAGRPGKAGAIALQWLCSAFINTRYGRGVSRRTASQFPFGYMLIAQKP